MRNPDTNAGEPVATFNKPDAPRKVPKADTNVDEPAAVLRRIRHRIRTSVEGEGWNI